MKTLLLSLLLLPLLASAATRTVTINSTNNTVLYPTNGLVLPNWLALSGQTNRIMDDGSQLLFNGSAIGGASFWTTNESGSLIPSPNIEFLSVTNTTDVGFEFTSNSGMGIGTIIGSASEDSAFFQVETDGGDAAVRMQADTGGSSFKIDQGGVELVTMRPSEADGDTPYVFDRSVSAATGDHVEFRNANTLFGYITGTETQASFQLNEDGDANKYVRMVANGDGAAFRGYYEDGMDQYSIVLEGGPDSGNARLLVSKGVEQSTLTQEGLVTTGTLTFGSAGDNILNPDAADGSPIVDLNASVDHTTGLLLSIKNNTAEVMTLLAGSVFSIFGTTAEVSTVSPSDNEVSMHSGAPGENYLHITDDDSFAFHADVTGIITAGTLTTGDPAGGSGEWKLGQSTAAVVLTLITDEYLEVMVDGVVKKVALVND